MLLTWKTAGAASDAFFGLTATVPPVQISETLTVAALFGEKSLVTVYCAEVGGSVGVGVGLGVGLGVGVGVGVGLGVGVGVGHVPVPTMSCAVPTELLL